MSKNSYNEAAHKFSSKKPNPIQDFQPWQTPFLLIDPKPEKEIDAKPCDNCNQIIGATSSEPCPYCGN